MIDNKYGAPVGSKGMYIIDTASWRFQRPIIDKKLCVNCGVCMSYCPVFSIICDDGKNYYIDLSHCKGCGICANECPKNAIKLIPEGEITSHVENSSNRQ